MKSCLLLALSLVPNMTFAQTPVHPTAQEHKGALPLSKVAVIQAPPGPSSVSITPWTGGTYENLSPRTQLWRLRVRAPQASSIQLSFDEFLLPVGARLIVYSNDYRRVTPPYDATYNTPDLRLQTQAIASDDVVVELTFPLSQVNQILLRLSGVETTYNGLNRGHGGGAGEDGAPVNDDCAGAILITSGVNGPFSNMGATPSLPTNAFCAGAPGPFLDVWFTYSATTTDTITVVACTPDPAFNAVMELFSGSCTTLNPMSCRNQGCPNSNGAEITFSANAGTSYQIRVAAYVGATGSFEITVAGGGSPPNDECATPVSVDLGVNGPFSNMGASASTPAFSCGGGGSDLWYSFIAPESGAFTLDTCQTRSVDTILEVYDGTCGSLTSLACNDDFCGTGSRVTFFAAQGSLYLIRVGGSGGATGDFSIDITRGGFASSILVSQASYKATGTRGKDSVQVQGWYNRDTMPLDPTSGGTFSLGLGANMYTVNLSPQDAAAFQQRGTKWSFTNQALGLKIVFDEAKSTFQLQAKNQPPLPTFGMAVEFQIAFSTLQGAQTLAFDRSKFKAGKAELDGDVFFITKASISKGRTPGTDKVTLQGMFHTANPTANIGPMSNAGIVIGEFSQNLQSGLPFRSRDPGVSSFAYDPARSTFQLQAKSIDVGTPVQNAMTQLTPVSIQIIFGDNAVGATTLNMRGDPAKRLSFP